MSFNIEGKFKYNFPGCENISEYYSQVCQDIFVLSVLDGKTNGTYLEVGAYLPDSINNTYLLAKNYNWSGVSIDIQRSNWSDVRPNDIYLVADALNLSYSNLFKEYFSNTNVIDYLQLDIEPSINTLNALFKVFESEQRFRVITFEHDIYTGGHVARNLSRDFLKKLGYTLIVSDVITDENYPFEDWWVDLNLVNREVALDIAEASKNIKFPRNFLFIN
jgi:hypothetical protein